MVDALLASHIRDLLRLMGRIFSLSDTELPGGRREKIKAQWEGYGELDPGVLIRLYHLVFQYCEQILLKWMQPIVEVNSELWDYKVGTRELHMQDNKRMGVQSAPYWTTDQREKDTKIPGTGNIAPWCYCKRILWEKRILLRTSQNILQSVHLGNRRKGTRNYN